MLDFTAILYVILILFLISFLFSFWLIVVWVGLVHCYIYLEEWRTNRKAVIKADSKDFFPQMEELRNEFK